RSRSNGRRNRFETAYRRRLGVNVHVVLERHYRRDAAAYVSARKRLREGSAMTAKVLSRKHHLLTEPEALDWLEQAAREVPRDQAIVELGVYRGDSLVRLALGSRAGEGAHCWGIDPWGLPGAYATRPAMRRKYGIQNMYVAQRELERRCVTQLVTLVRDFSVSVGQRWSGPRVGLLYIDALHTEEAVLCDYEAWAPHLAPGSIVAYDDYCPRFP